MVMSSIPQSRSSSPSTNVSQKAGVTIHKFTDKVEMHVHTTSQTLDDHAKDELMAQLFEVFGQAAERFAGKL
jgi:diaminopimelate decarboxylase